MNLKWLCKIWLHDWVDVSHPDTIFATQEKCQMCGKVRPIPPDLSALDGI
jgi:hypothetical protein